MRTLVDTGDIYDDLSRMLQLYKHKTDYVQKLLFRYSHQFFDEKDTEDTKKYLSVLFLEETQLIDKYMLRKNESRSLKMVLYRFFSRIVEIIHIVRVRIRTKVYIAMVEYFNNVENLIYATVSLAGSDYLQGLCSFYDKSQNFAVNLIVRLEDKNIKHTTQPVTIPPKIQFKPNLKSNTPNPQIESPSPTKLPQSIGDQSPRKIHPPKIMEGLRVLDCLDVDIGTFRSTYLYCKHHSQIIQEETMERNPLVNSQINAYKRAYGDYLIRKARRATYTKKWSLDQRVKRQTISKQQPVNIPLKVIPQTATLQKQTRQSHIVEKEYSSVRKIQPKPQRQFAYKENNSISFIDASKAISNYFRSPKMGLSPKKVLLSYNILSLRPVEQQGKTSTAQNSKKRSRTRSSSRRRGDSFQMLIEGQKMKEVKDMQHRKCSIKIFSEKTFMSNLFTG